MLLLMKVLIRGRFMAFNLMPKSNIGMAEISTFGRPMKETVACLTKGGLLLMGWVSVRFDRVIVMNLLRYQLHSDPHCTNTSSQLDPYSYE